MAGDIEQVESLSDIAPVVHGGAEACLIREHPDYPGELLVQPTGDPSQFIREHRDFLSPIGALSDLYLIDLLRERLTEKGVRLFSMPDADPILEQHRRLSEPLAVSGLDGELYPFQQFALRRALGLTEGEDRRSGFFFNLGTGTGKGFIGAAGAHELIVNRGEIDLCIFMTLRKVKINMARQVETISPLRADVIEGSKALRTRRYRESEAQVWVLNYERAHYDFDALAEVVRGKRVLFVLDEVQKVLRGENKKNTARKGLDRLIGLCDRSVVWPMSASIIRQSPLRYHDVFDLIGVGNPLGTRGDFVDRYCSSVESFAINDRVRVKKYNWDPTALVDVKHRVSGLTQALRKTDPGVRDFFKGMTTEVVKVHRSSEERRLYRAVVDRAKREIAGDLPADEPSFSASEYSAALRHICNTPSSMLSSESAVPDWLRSEHPDLLSKPSSKFEMVCDQIESIRDQGDQVVVFTAYTNLCLFHLSDELKARKIKHVVHYGTGMTGDEAQRAQDQFKSDPETTVFLSSDAGAFGLSFQNARFVIHVESPSLYDTFMQRSDRIDRADSYLDGLTSYVYVCEGSVEERVWATMNERRMISSAVQGTHEELSRDGGKDQMDEKHLIFAAIEADS